MTPARDHQGSGLPGVALALWAAFALLAIGNGLAREALLAPALGGAAAHVVSTAILCALILALTFGARRWLGPRSAREAWSIGWLWLLLTVAFEFGFGHWVAGKSWTVLLADYDLSAGRVWLLVPMTLLLAPRLVQLRRSPPA